MNSGFTRFAVAGLFLLGSTAAPMTAAADDKVPDHTLDEFKLGKVIMGDKAALKNLEGKVVALEMWGIR